MNSVLFLDRNTAESTGASRAQTTDSLTVPDRVDTVSWRDGSAIIRWSSWLTRDRP